MKLIFLICLAIFEFSSYAAGSCEGLLTAGQRQRVTRLKTDGVDVKILSKTIAGQVRTVVVAPVKTKELLAKLNMNHHVGHAFDEKGLVAASPSQRLNILSSLNSYILSFGQRIFAGVGLARLKLRNFSDFYGVPRRINRVDLRKKLINKFKWEYTLKSALGKEMMNRDLTLLDKKAQSVTLRFGSSTDAIPVRLLIQAINQPLRDYRDLEIGTPLGRKSGALAAATVLGLGSLFVTPMISLPLRGILPFRLLMDYEFASLVLDVVAERYPEIRQHEYYRKFSPFAGVREGELNRAVLANVDERFVASGAEQYLLMVNPLRADRLVKTFLNNGYVEEILEDPESFSAELSGI